MRGRALEAPPLIPLLSSKEEMSHTVSSSPTPIEDALLHCAVESDCEDPLFSLLFNQSPLGVGVVEWLGDDLRFLAVNEMEASRVGRTAQEIRGWRARDLGAPADVFPQLARLAAEALRRGGPAHLEWSGSWLPEMRHFRTVATPLPSPAGHPPRFAFLSEEVTQLRALEMRLGGPGASTSLAQDVEQPLAQGLRALGVASDEVETVVACYPELELEDAAQTLREGLRHAERAQRALRQMLSGFAGGRSRH